MAKKGCKVSRVEFHEKAQELEVVINGVKLTLRPGEFNSDSLGWKYQEKLDLPLPGLEGEHYVSIGLNIVLVNSKKLD